MKFVLCCLALAASAAPGTPEELTPVAIETRFRHAPDRLVLQAAQQEVDTILAPLKLPFTWLDRAAGVIPGQLVVVTFRGDCDLRRLALAGKAAGPLGWTHVTDGVVLPFAVVDCDRVREFLRAGLLRIHADRREQALGRALGRVAAHELYHILARTGQHGVTGVGRPYFSVRELTAAGFDLAEREFGALRAGLRAKGSPEAGRSLFQRSGCPSCHGEGGSGTRWAPALRAPDRSVALAAIDYKLVRDLRRMYRSVRGRRLAPPALDAGQIEDLESYLESRPE